MSRYLPNFDRIASLRAGYNLALEHLMPKEDLPRAHCRLSKGSCKRSQPVDMNNTQAAVKELRAHATEHLDGAVGKEASTDTSAGAASTSKPRNAPTAKKGRPIKPLRSGNQMVTCGWGGWCTMQMSRSNFVAHVLGVHFQPLTSHTCPLCGSEIARHPTLTDEQPARWVPVQTAYGGDGRWLNATDIREVVLQDILLEHYELKDEWGRDVCGGLKKLMRRDYGWEDVLRDGWLEDRPPYRLKTQPYAAMQAPRRVPARC